MCCTLLENVTGETARHFCLGSRRRSLQAVRIEGNSEVEEKTTAEVRF